MLLYGWDRDALPFIFPSGQFIDPWRSRRRPPSSSDIGTVVGKNTPYKYLVVNIHFVPIVKNDYSGNQLLISRKRFEHFSNDDGRSFDLFVLDESISLE